MTSKGNKFLLFPSKADSCATLKQSASTFRPVMGEVKNIDYLITMAPVSGQEALVSK